VLARTPIRGLRRTIANRMAASLAEAAQVSGHFEADVSRLLAIRQRFVERADQLGTRVSVNAFLIKAIAAAVRRVPQVNACVEGEEVVVYENVNMGIATSLPGANDFDSALVVAVLPDVERKGLIEIDQEMKALLGRVREGRGKPDDFAGSTITISSTAGIGPPGLTSTPVLNRPNVFMLGPSTPIERLRGNEGVYVSATMLPISYTFDHRAIDGEPTARFLAALHEVLENPELMLA
jgi:pyruvate/2-oxoglutarate dehydrogenase complex dihydrolipoamide acyltransferase (E2) component